MSARNSAAGSRVASFHIFESLANPFNRLPEILPFPLQISCQSAVQGCGRIQAAPPGVFLQLCLTVPNKMVMGGCPPAKR